MTEIKIEMIEGPIGDEGVPEAWGSGSFGAILTFRGVVRGRNHGRSVKAVFYEAFEPLARSVLDAICREALLKFRVDDGKMYIAHSTGEILPGQASLVVAVATIHRAEGFGAAQYAIDELKRRVPIWKLEHYSDGTSAWLRGCALPGHTQATGGEHG